MLSIIVAMAENNVIGKDNKLLWHVPEDLKRFKSITSGNIIITRDENYSVDNPNVEVIHNLSQVINTYKNPSKHAFIIGGGDIYKQVIHIVDKIFLTKIYESFEGDTTFPQIDFNEFNIEFESEVYTSEKNNLKYQFIDLTRK